MQNKPIPWHKADILHDDVTSYPLENYLPLADMDVTIHEKELPEPV